MRGLVFIGMWLVVAGCAPHLEVVQLNEGANMVKVFRKVDPPSSCSEIAPFTAVSGNGCGALGNPGNSTAAYATFKNMVVGMGGNAGLIVSEIPPVPVPGCWVNEYVINGVAYKCPDSVLK